MGNKFFTPHKAQAIKLKACWRFSFMCDSHSNSHWSLMLSPFPTRYNMIGLKWSLDDFKKLYRSQAGGLTSVFHNVLTKNLKKESNALFSTEEVGAEAVSSSVSPIRMFHLAMELCHSWKLSLFLPGLPSDANVPLWHWAQEWGHLIDKSYILVKVEHQRRT